MHNQYGAVRLWMSDRKKDERERSEQGKWDADEEDKYAEPWSSGEERRVRSAGDSFPLRMLTENRVADRDTRRWTGGGEQRMDGFPAGGTNSDWAMEPKEKAEAKNRLIKTWRCAEGGECRESGERYCRFSPVLTSFCAFLRINP